ncbi:hypothetical protein NBRC116587_00840 [Pseudoteredinibacter isoporae]
MIRFSRAILMGRGLRLGRTLTLKTSATNIARHIGQPIRKNELRPAMEWLSERVNRAVPVVREVQHLISVIDRGIVLREAYHAADIVSILKDPTVKKNKTI